MTVRGRLGAYARLLRLPAGLTVPGDVLAGAAAGGAPVGARLLGPVASSLCLYWGGMALNDYADRDVDARERPDRPVPSGAISPTAALTTATALTAAGLALTVLTEGRRGLYTAVPLTAAIWTYDVLAKDSPTAGPVVMATARALDILRGAGPGHLTKALPTALMSGLHTAALTALSRHEAAPAAGTGAGAGSRGGGVRNAGVAVGSAGVAVGSAAVGVSSADVGVGRAPRSVPALAEQPTGFTAATRPEPLPGTTDTTGTTSTGTGRMARRSARDAALGSLGAAAAVGIGVGLAAKDAAPRDRIVAGGLTLGFLAAAGPAPLAAVRKPTPYRVRRAVAAGIHAMVPLQSALVAAAGRGGAGLALLAAYPVARRLSRKVSPT